MRANEWSPGIVFRWARLTAAAALLLAAGAAAGCGSAEDGVREAPAGTIRGTIQYAGPAAAPGRPLAIAAYRSFPPRGPPAASLLVERYELPFCYQLDGLAPGTYYVGALIDVSLMDTRHAGMLSPAHDPHGYFGDGEPVSLGEDHGAALVDVQLRDPAE